MRITIDEKDMLTIAIGITAMRRHRNFIVMGLLIVVIRQLPITFIIMVPVDTILNIIIRLRLPCRV